MKRIVFACVSSLASINANASDFYIETKNCSNLLASMEFGVDEIKPFESNNPILLCHKYKTEVLCDISFFNTDEERKGVKYGILVDSPPYLVLSIEDANVEFISINTSTNAASISSKSMTPVYTVVKLCKGYFVYLKHE